VTSIVIELHDELARWLETSAAKRRVSVEFAALQLLEEARMRASGLTQLEIPFNGERWTTKIPMRGLLYTDYDTEWTRSSPVAQSALDAV
jgi:hypothetical protein